MAEATQVHPRRKAALREFLARCFQNSITYFEGDEAHDLVFEGTLPQFAHKLGFVSADSLKTNIAEGYVVQNGDEVNVKLDRFVEALGAETVSNIMTGKIVITIGNTGRKKKDASAASSSAVPRKRSVNGSTIENVTSNLKDAIQALKFVERVGVDKVFLSQPVVGVMFTNIYRLAAGCLESGQPQLSSAKIKFLVTSNPTMSTKASLECANAALTLAEAAQKDKGIQTVLDRNPGVFIFVTEILFG